MMLLQRPLRHFVKAPPQKVYLGQKELHMYDLAGKLLLVLFICCFLQVHTSDIDCNNLCRACACLPCNDIKKPEDAPETGNKSLDAELYRCYKGRCDSLFRLVDNELLPLELNSAESSW